jgi:hypothetical protein
MELAQTLEGALARLLAAGRVEVQENGAWLAALEGFQYEVRQQKDAALLHLWSSERNLVRRVLRITCEEPQRLALQVARLGRSRPARLEFIAAETRRPAGRVTREQFRARFRELLLQQFPDETVSSLTTKPDLEHSLSGNYVRGVLRAGSRYWAVLGVAPAESAATYDGLLTFGLLWLDRARQSSRPGPVAGLRLFFPEGAGRTTAQRMAALSASAPVELYEYSRQSWRARRLDPLDVGNVETSLAPRRETEALLGQAAPFVDPLRRSAPGAIRADVLPGTSHVAVRFRGLLFARWQPDGVFFGLGDPRQPLSAGGQSRFQALLRALETHRSPLASDTTHSLYRAQPERWLETLIAADPARADARLDPRFVYPQVPAVSAGDRGIMDLVCVTRDARLAVLELKAKEDIQMALQAVDYWLRVRWHHTRQEFSHFGYFPGVTLDPRPPRLLLIAPSLRFHPATDVILRHLHRDIEVVRVGLNEQWRRGLKVVLRQGPANPDGEAAARARLGYHAL